MTTVEHMLNGLSTLVVKGAIKDSWHRSFISNVQNHVLEGNSLSTNQGVIVLKAASKWGNELARELGVGKPQLDSAILNPTYKKIPYQSISVKREVRYVGMNFLAFRFKLDQTVVSELKACRSQHDPVGQNPYFDYTNRIWVVAVTPHNIEKVFGIIKSHKFEFDSDVLEYMTLATNSKGQPSTFAAIEGEDMLVANICANPLLSHVVKTTMNGTPV